MKKFNHLRLKVKTKTPLQREGGKISQRRKSTSDRFQSPFPHLSLQSPVQSERERERDSEEGRETLSGHYENTVCFHFLFVFCCHGSGK